MVQTRVLNFNAVTLLLGGREGGVVHGGRGEKMSRKAATSIHERPACAEADCPGGSWS